MTIILVAGGYFWDLEVKSTKRMKLSVLFLVKSHFSNRQFMKMFSWNYHSYGCILQGVTHNYLLPWLPHWISKMANHGMCDGKCCHSRLYLLQFFLQISHIWTINKTSQNVFETIVNKKGAHAPGHHDLHIRLSKWPLAMAHPSNWKLLEVQQGVLYISVSKV